MKLLVVNSAQFGALAAAAYRINELLYISWNMICLSIETAAQV